MRKSKLLALLLISLIILSLFSGCKKSETIDSGNQWSPTEIITTTEPLPSDLAEVVDEMVIGKKVCINIPSNWKNDNSTIDNANLIDDEGNDINIKTLSELLMPMQKLYLKSIQGASEIVNGDIEGRSYSYVVNDSVCVCAYDISEDFGCLITMPLKYSKNIEGFLKNISINTDYTEYVPELPTELPCMSESEID